MKDDLREAVARAMWVAKGFSAETLYQHHEWEDWPTDKRTEHTGFGGETVVTLMHYGWRKMLPLADAAIAAARPVIGEECAKVADAARETWQKAADKLDGNEVLRNHAAAAETIAANIRSATQNAHRPLGT
jgi:hypothetical protein